jgi:hypothetical protein
MISRARPIAIVLGATTLVAACKSVPDKPRPVEGPRTGEAAAASASAPAASATPSGARGVDLGYARDMVCVTGLPADTTKCWGQNLGGIFGEKVIYRSVATDVPSLRAASAIVGGFEWDACAIFAGKVKCWGGQGDPKLHEIAGVDRVVSLSSNDQTKCVVTETGQPLCWGNNIAGTLGDGTTLSRETPAPVKNLPAVDEVRVGHGAVFARKPDGSVVWWGRNWHLGLPTKDYPLPVPFPELGSVASLRGISQLGSMNCVLRRGGTVACWASKLPPTAVDAIGKAVDLATGSLNACAVAEDGRVGCWGFSLAVTWVQGITQAVRIVPAGFDGFCALERGGPIVCWGSSPWTHGDGEHFLADAAIYNGSGTGPKPPPTCAIPS